MSDREWSEDPGSPEADEGLELDPAMPDDEIDEALDDAE